MLPSASIARPSGWFRRGPLNTPSKKTDDCSNGITAAIGAPQLSRLASTLSATLPLSACEIGQPSLAPSAACLKPASSRPGTLPRTVSALDTTFQPPSTWSNVTSAETRNCSGGVLALPSPNESAIAKQLACAAATSSSGLVFPSDRSVREAQLTGRSLNAPLLLAETLPAPRASV